jgi:hypothetical protein
MSPSGMPLTSHGFFGDGINNLVQDTDMQEQ